MTETRLPSEQPNRLYRYMSNIDYITDMLVHNRFYCANPLVEFNDPFDTKIKVRFKGDESLWRRFLNDKWDLAEDAVLCLYDNREVYASAEEGSFGKRLFDCLSNIRTKEECLSKKKDIELIMIDQMIVEAKEIDFDTDNIQDIDRFLKKKTVLGMFYSGFDLKDYLSATRAFCLSSKNDEILLWSHYANSHKGVCFGFRFYKDHEDIRFFKTSHESGKVGFRKVEYPPELDSLNVLESYRLGKPIRIASAFHKYEVWAYEKEYRTSLHKDSLIDGNYLLLKRTELKEVIFGVYCDKRRQETIVSLVKKYYGEDVQFYKSRQSIHEYKVINERIYP